MTKKFSISLSRYRRTRKHLKWWDHLILIYGGTCVYCHRSPATQIDHVIPISYITYHGIENLRPCCGWCNLLVGSEVFETFEEKYEWLREARKRKRKHQNRQTICTDCWLPYQCPLHSPAMFQCPECYDRENSTRYAIKKEWQSWLLLLQKAGIKIDVHHLFGDEIYRLRGASLSKKQKSTLFGSIYTSFSDEEDFDILSEKTFVYAIEDIVDEGEA